jgi:hypothetical protein
MNEIRPPRRRRPAKQPDLAPHGRPPHIAVAPAVLGRTLTVVREPGDTDESYQRRCELLTVLLEHAANQD